MHVGVLWSQHWGNIGRAVEGWAAHRSQLCMHHSSQPSHRSARSAADTGCSAQVRPYVELLAPLALLGQLPQHQVVLLPRLGEPLFKSTATREGAAVNRESKAPLRERAQTTCGSSDVLHMATRRTSAVRQAEMRPPRPVGFRGHSAASSPRPSPSASWRASGRTCDQPERSSHM
jgi:hypothetical protein